MTTADFRAWLNRRGLTHAQAAPLLAAHPKEIARWASAKGRPVPRRVARIIELLDRIEELERAGVGR